MKVSRKRRRVRLSSRFGTDYSPFFPRHDYTILVGGRGSTSAEKLGASCVPDWDAWFELGWEHFARTLRDQARKESTVDESLSTDEEKQALNNAKKADVVGCGSCWGALPSGAVAWFWGDLGDLYHPAWGSWGRGWFSLSSAVGRET